MAGREPDGLRIAVARDGAAVLRLTGVLSADSSESVRAHLVPLLRELDCVVVDLDDVDVADPADLGVFASALFEAGGWPVARLAVLAARPAMLRALAEAGVDRLVAVTSGTDGARAACESRPTEVRTGWTLAAEDSAPQRARQLLQERLHLWGYPERSAAHAVQILNELVTNTVEHTADQARITVRLEDDVLLCAVRDDDPVPPVARRPARGASGGYGLLLVDTLARDWGWVGHRDGKTVWAAVAPPDRPAGSAPRPTTADTKTPRRHGC